LTLAGRPGQDQAGRDVTRAESKLRTQGLTSSARADQRPRAEALREQPLAAGASRAPLSPRVLADDVRVLERAARFIDANLGSVELQPSLIWKAAHVSRSRLYRVFAPLGGVSRYVARRRLAQAYAALTQPSEPRTIASIAHDLGFANVSHFARSFRTAFGRTARQVRSAAPAASADAPAPPPEHRSWIDDAAQLRADDGPERH
jgi:AraC-like DNA-binding protein